MVTLNYDWTLKDANFTKDRGKVFSCFSCGGGSTMGYKLAGFDVIGCNEIDPRMMAVYRKNHDPKFHFLESIQTFKLREDLPEELFHLDILDGSPPCSSFSMAGSREDDWGKEKKFREGQADQILDTLFFDFIDLAARLQPKVVIAENVKGLLLGEAKGYVNRILLAFDKAGYFVRYDLLNASKMGVPQRRERVFFSAIRKDLYRGEFDDMFQTDPRLKLEFVLPEVPFYEVEDSSDTVENMPPSYLREWKKMDGIFGSFSQVHDKGSFFNEIKVNPDKPCETLTGQGKLYHPTIPRRLNTSEFVKVGSFPSDYNFLEEKPFYIIGMSVPPLMTARVADQVTLQWLEP